ncbi:MAG: HAD family phosphatase [Bacillota bacterium]|nr:HAD family phosphatase [Bacillota bacterium]
MKWLTNNIKEFEGAIFDVDGVLLDSMKIWDEVGIRYLRKMNRIPSVTLNEDLSTLSLEQGAAYLKKEYDLECSKQEILEGVLQIIEDFYVYEAPLKKNVKEILKLLKKNSIKMIIASSSDKELIRKALTRLNVDSYFEDICTCSAYNTSKTKPDLYFLCSQKINTPISKTLVFEDALHAIETCVKAGFPVIGVYDESSEKQKETIKQICTHYLEDL